MEGASNRQNSELYRILEGKWDDMEKNKHW